LLENQLTGESSIQAYINAFYLGCKCVELDCWDGENNSPVITHGFTMTSKILFIDVIRTIKQYGFIFSPYPIVLSLEMHCSTIQQDVIASILRQEFGPDLFLLNSHNKNL
jgi:hypothetical protein